MATHVERLSGIVTWALAIGAFTAGAHGQQQTAAPAQAAPRCRLEGRVTSGIVPLPGVSIVVHVGEALEAATSTDVDGRYTVNVTANAAYHVSADLTGFVGAEHDVMAAAPCDRTLDFEFALQPRTSRPIASSPTTPQTAPRFQTLNLQTDVSGAAAIAGDATPSQETEDVARLLPPGFSLQNAQTDAIAITGSSDATNFDRSMLNDRSQGIALGGFDPATGQFAQGFGPPDGAGRGGPGGPGGGRAGFGGPGGVGQAGLQGFPGGRGGFMLGGRGARGQRPYQGSITYTFGGSALNSPPYQLRPDVPVTQPQFAQNSFGATFGGPLKIKGLYADTNRRTNFQINFTGSESNNLFDQYATVPTSAMRTGDFSASPIALIDPATGQPFPGNQIPTGRIDPSAASLLQFIPAPNLPGSAENFHVSTTVHSSSEAISLRLIQNLSRTVAQGGGRGAPGGRGRGPGAGRGTNIVLSRVTSRSGGASPAATAAACHTRSRRRWTTRHRSARAVRSSRRTTRTSTANGRPRASIDASRFPATCTSSCPGGRITGG
jgi:hypothetical protein